MTATMMKVKTTPMAPYLGLMRGMTREDKLAVVAFLVDTMQHEEPQRMDDDEIFVRDFLATPFDNPMTADEEKQLIRESHHFERMPEVKIENWLY